MDKKYEDMLYMTHHISKKHPRMSMDSRAGQFSPFAALTGYDTALAETSRLTDKRVEISENRINELEDKLQFIYEHLQDKIDVTITFFKPDIKKSGGSYITTSGYVKKIDKLNKTVIMDNHTVIPICEIYDIY